ncbi:MAG: molybdenum cofactor biosynthesis protein MoeB, partial [Candidatus Eisenbacteria bacterium]|nr:molybdenum cofactor biosynthesis protein MoeB [Candidatus Eisenbacteria bacterium]
PKEEEEELVVPEITPRQLAERRSELFLVDVREPHEVDIAKIDGAHLIPLREVSSRFGELDPDKEIVVHCRSGKRSAAAVHFLMGQGFNNIHNLRGGILAWSDEVDPAIAKY